MMKLVYVFFGLISFSAVQAAEFFHCEIPAYYTDLRKLDQMDKDAESNPDKKPDLNSIPLLGALVTMSMEEGKIAGTVSVSELGLELSEEVSKMELPIDRLAQEPLAKAIRDLGLEGKVAAADDYVFGKATHMGAAAGVTILKDKDGKELDQLIFIWGALGYGSCQQKKLLLMDLK